MIVPLKQVLSGGGGEDSLKPGVVAIMRSQLHFVRTKCLTSLLQDPKITIYFNKKVLTLHYFPFFFLPLSGGWIHAVLLSVLVATFVMRMRHWNQNVSCAI